MFPVLSGIITTAATWITEKSSSCPLTHSHSCLCFAKCLQQFPLQLSASHWLLSLLVSLGGVSLLAHPGHLGCLQLLSPQTPAVPCLEPRLSACTPGAASAAFVAALLPFSVSECWRCLCVQPKCPLLPSVPPPGGEPAGCTALGWAENCFSTSMP